MFIPSISFIANVTTYTIERLSVHRLSCTRIEVFVHRVTLGTAELSVSSAQLLVNASSQN